MADKAPFFITLAHARWRSMKLLAFLAIVTTIIAGHSLFMSQAARADNKTFSTSEILDSGHRFFGGAARTLAEVVEEATKRFGQPNGYILGQEASGAFVGGLRYGDGMMYTRNAGDRHVYWQGPSIGFDYGGDGDRTMMLVYNMPSVDAIFQRFVGLNGSAYFVGGLGFTALTADNIVVVPIRAGVGARLGINVGYLKFTPDQTWNPF